MNPLSVTSASWSLCKGHLTKCCLVMNSHSELASYKPFTILCMVMNVWPCESWLFSCQSFAETLVSCLSSYSLHYSKHWSISVTVQLQNQLVFLFKNKTATLVTKQWECAYDPPHIKAGLLTLFSNQHIVFSLRLNMLAWEASLLLFCRLLLLALDKTLARNSSCTVCQRPINEGLNQRLIKERCAMTFLRDRAYNVHRVVEKLGEKSNRPNIAPNFDGS